MADLPNVAELECVRCRMVTTHERMPRGMSCIRCRVIDEHLRTRMSQRSRPSIDPVRAIGSALIIGLGVAFTYTCMSSRSEERPTATSAPVKAAEPDVVDEIGPPHIVVTGIPAKRGQRAVAHEAAAATALIEWCGHGKVPFWRTRGLRVEATYVSATLVNVSVDHPRKDAIVDGNTLWYAIGFKGDRPVTITAQKEISARACRELGANEPTPME